MDYVYGAMIATYVEMIHSMVDVGGYVSISLIDWRYIPSILAWGMMYGA